MKNKEIFVLIKNIDSEAIINEEDTFIKISNSKWAAIASFLKDDENLKFDYLMSITSYHKPEEALFGVAYNFHSYDLKHYLEIRIEVKESEEIASISELWKAADWHEREAFDLMGINFKGHENLKRILLPDDWDGHPLRKDYKTQEYYHGMPVPKDKTYWD